MDTLALRQTMRDHATALPQADCTARNLRYTVAEHLDPTTDQELTDLFFEYFLNSSDEIKVAVAGNNFTGDGESYDYSKAYLPMLVDVTSGKAVAAAIVVAKTIRKTKQVHEVVWLAATRTQALAGLGALLFTKLHEMCSTIRGLEAIVVESTNRALTWWISRPGVPISRFLLRATSRPCLMREGSKLSPDEDENAKLRMILERLVDPPRAGGDGSSTCSSRSQRQKQRGKARKQLQPQKAIQPSSTFCFQPFPTVELESIYTDTVFRNKRGKPTKSCAIFQGLPYRYSTDQATHLCFPITKSFRKSLGIANLVMNPVKLRLHGSAALADVRGAATAALSNQDSAKQAEFDGYETASTVTIISMPGEREVPPAKVAAPSQLASCIVSVTRRTSDQEPGVLTPTGVSSASGDRNCEGTTTPQPTLLQTAKVN